MSEQVFERANHRHDAFFVAGFARQAQRCSPESQPPDPSNELKEH